MVEIHKVRMCILKVSTVVSGGLGAETELQTVKIHMCSNGDISKSHWRAHLLTIADKTTSDAWQLLPYFIGDTLFPQGRMCSIHTKLSFTFTVLDLVMEMLLCLHNLLAKLVVFNPPLNSPSASLGHYTHKRMHIWTHAHKHSCSNPYLHM